MQGEEKTLYVAGDTIWYEKVAENLDKFSPDVIILNACGAKLEQFGRLIMNADDVEKVIKYASDSHIILSHMDNVAHSSLSRTALRNHLEKSGLLSNVKIPEDGEIILTFKNS